MIKTKSLIIGTMKEWNEKIKKERSCKKWCAWLGASFAKWHGWYEAAKRDPDRYKEGAAKQFAQMAMSDFKELCKLDKEAARMVYDSWSFNIVEMVQAIDEKMDDYFRMMY